MYHNWMGTLSSSPCQLRLGGCLSHLGVTEEQWMFLVVTLGGCSGRTRWSSSLDCSPTYTITTVDVP